MNMGLRYEFDYTHTIQDGVFYYNKRYHDLLPNLQVGYRVNDDLDLMASYRRTLVRPSYNQLRSTFYFNVLPYNSLGYSLLSSSDFMTGHSSQENLPSNSLSPNIIYLGADDIATGNPELRPTATDRFALTAQYKHFAAQLSYSRVDNAIQTVHQLLSSGSLCQSPINIGRIHALSLDLDYSYSNRYLNVFLLASGTWSRIPVPSLGRNKIESRPFAMLQGNLQYNLSKHVMLGCDLLYSTPWISGCSTRCNSKLGLNLSVMAHLLGDRLTLGANFNDVFNRSMSTRNETQYGNVFNRTDIHNDSRSVSLMVRWTFNTINNPFKRRSGNDATLQRTQETVN
jgi:outer membrane receptor protein involved in Fe transport